MIRREECMNRGIAAAAVLLFGALLFTACRDWVKVDGPAPGQTNTGKPSGRPAEGSGGDAGETAAEKPVPRGDGPEGVWYEQAEDADTLEIAGKKIKFTSHDGSWEDEVSYTYNGIGKEPELKLSDTFMYEDMYYNKADDMVIAYTWSHTDGDGGHHRVEFKRNKYVAPPPPVYPPAVNQSDPSAKKDFEDLTIRSMKVSFHDKGMPYDVNSSMALQPPFEDDYSYDLKVLEDGTGLVSSSFCQEIDIPKETVDELQRMVKEADLGKINGIDIHTEGVPYGSPEYTAEIELASGDIIRSSANWTDVPENWEKFQEPMHHLLFFAFVDAGYQYGSGDFHSTKPMKRVQGEETLRNEATGIAEEEVYIKPDWKKSYDYTLDTHYFVFSDPENRYPALMKTLERLSAEYKATAEQTLKKHYEVMEKVPASVYKKADRKYCYSLYAVDHWSLSGNIFSFSVSEGEATSLGVGDFGYGKYRYTRFNIDADTGEILAVSDLFQNTDAVYEALMEKFSHYGTHNDYGKFVHSEAFPAKLREWLSKPEPEGIGFNAAYHYLEFWMPLGMYKGNDSQLMERLYYDEIQDILGEKYTSVW